MASSSNDPIQQSSMKKKKIPSDLVSAEPSCSTQEPERLSSIPDEFTSDLSKASWDSYKSQDSDPLDDFKGFSELDSIGEASCSNLPDSASNNQVHSTGAEMLDRRYKVKPQKDKLCGVCGDKALGYNFNAISCESCKAFFRRNAFKEIRGRCEGKCDVTVESRSYCKKCRLRKCFEIGMKRDLILNDQQRQVRRIKIQENRYRRQGMPVPVELQKEAKVVASTPVTPKKSATSASTSATPSMTEKEDPKTITHTIAKDVIEPNRIEGLREDAQKAIAELRDAFAISFDGPMEREPTSAPSNTDFLNMADTSVRRLVKMAKHLQCFRNFDQEDQISLLKGSVVEVLVLRSAKMFDTTSKGWFVNKGGEQHMVAAQNMFSNKESMSFLEQYQRFATSLLQSTHHDNIVLMLMIVMTVMSTDRSSIKSTKLIAETQERYASILQHYVELRYPEDETMFAKVLQKLADVRNLNETHTRMLMHMRVEDLEPLIIEIFDISA